MNHFLFSKALFMAGAPLWFATLDEATQRDLAAPHINMGLHGEEIVYRGLVAAPEHAAGLRLVTNMDGEAGYQIQGLITTEPGRDAEFWSAVADIIEANATFFEVQ